MIKKKYGTDRDKDLGQGNKGGHTIGVGSVSGD